MRHIYKNAALMAIWELPANLCALLGIVVLTAVISTIFMLTGSYTANLIIAGVLAVLVVPAYVSTIINYFAFPKIEKVLILGQKEAEKGKEHDEREAPSQSLEDALEDDPEAESLLREKAKGSEEYVFHNGRMIKRSLLEEYYAGEAEQDDE
jgi:predicted integral membrane protein